MRLLKRERSGWLANSYTFSLIDYNPRDSLPYAILSHRWGSDEVTYRDVRNGTVKKKAGGYKKLEFCAEQAFRDGLVYFWIDTCCIDKTDSMEVSTAVNSMFRWYQQAAKCYVYLPDVSADQGWEAEFQQSEWFERGWTLQELIAPSVVEFYSVGSTRLGDKKSLERQIHQITGIPVAALQSKSLAQIDQQERFSWTARRQVTLEEDAVYCLLGIFDIHMPLLYGEGSQKALARLQREIRIAADPNLYIAQNVPWVVPFERNRLFTGRGTQLTELQDALFSRDSPQRIAITGLGGTGKTQLVLELLYRSKRTYPDCAVLWISATTRESLRLSYLTIAQQLRIANCEEETANVLQLVQDHLGRDAAGRWLLIFDNADNLEMWTSPAPVRESRGSDCIDRSTTGQPRRLMDYLPRSKRGRIVFTTRNREVAVRLAWSNIVTVPEMGAETATELLKKMLIHPELADNPQDVTALLATLTYLPLAISQATAYINIKDTSLTDYLSLLQEQEDEVIDLLSEDFEDHGRYRDIKNPIATTWLVSFDQIRQSDPLAAEYLSFMACINFRDIPQSLLPRGLSRKKEMDAIGTLTAYSFVTRRSASATLDLHRLVHLATRSWLRQADLLPRWTERATAHLAAVFPDSRHEQRATWREYLPHAQRVLASDLLSQYDKQRVDLMLKCGSCLFSDGRWGEAQQLYAQVLEIQEVELGPSHPNTLISLSDLALVLQYQGKYTEAKEIGRRALAGMEKELGPSHPETLISLSNLAIVLQYQGKYTEAEEIGRRALAGMEKELGPSHPSTLISLSNLAIVLQCQGKYTEAEEIGRRAATRPAINGANVYTTGTVYHHGAR